MIPRVAELGHQLGGEPFPQRVLAGKVHFSFGVQYVHSNTILSTTVLGEEMEVTFTTGSLRAPVRFGYRFVEPSESPVFNPRIFGGVAPSLPLSWSFDEEGYTDVEVGSAQIALTFGAGLDIKFFFIEAGYDVGLVPMFDDDSITTDPKANMLQVNAGFRLKLAD